MGKNCVFPQHINIILKRYWNLIYFSWVLALGISVQFLQLLWDWQAEQHQVLFSGILQLPDTLTAPFLQVDEWRENSQVSFSSVGEGCNFQVGRGIRYCFLTIFSYSPRLCAQCFWHLGSKTWHDRIFCKLSSLNPQYK